ncbi:sirohydrochlorin chelatase [Streptomyces caatingaensis]|uniref:Cobalamin (Vitamin B12) biosynthesis CbiX protein n=1 Tax=Streptomyces caatingaensis TaxID=1678637 RepID=A0A0K9XJ26_9ACTN|nr:sirohydrochlorin chelatase [Streptomyces caatingaensis]KNB53370.1 cobalamin (vitamin B12) biosynthesis CbiX protein [Streptomyces caatingaensis]
MTLLLVAHGSRDPRHAATVAALRAGVAARRPGLRVEAGFLDFYTPSVSEALERLAADGVRSAVAVPLLLTRAFHARTDIPQVLRTCCPPSLTVHQSDVLGPSPLLVGALERRLAEAGVRDRSSTGVVLAAAGTSDPRGRAVVEGVARSWQHAGGWRAVRCAYASASGPRPEDAVHALRAAGCEHVAVARYVLAPGRLPDRIAAGAREAGADVVTDVLGVMGEVVTLVLRRYEETLPRPLPPRGNPHFTVSGALPPR